MHLLFCISGRTRESPQEKRPRTVAANTGYRDGKRQTFETVAHAHVRERWLTASLLQREHTDKAER